MQNEVTETTEQILQVETAITATRKEAAIPPETAAAIIAELGPIAARIDTYVSEASQCVVLDEASAGRYAGIVDMIDSDIKSVEKSETMSKIIAGLHKLHRQWTAARGCVLDPLGDSKKRIRGRIMEWQAKIQKEAAQRQAKLQAEADEKARRERDRLEAQAAKAKKPETVAAKLEQAAAVIAPTVIVAAPKMVRTRKVWRVKSVDASVFYAAVARDAGLQGFVEIKTTALERSKAENQAMTVSGVVFEQVEV